MISFSEKRSEGVWLRRMLSGLQKAVVLGGNY